MGIRDKATRVQSFVRDYTDGLTTTDLKRLVGPEASRAFDVLTRDHAGDEPSGRGRRLWHRTKILFLGLSYKLAPPRRLLFALCLVLALAGLVFNSQQESIYNARVLLGLSIVGLTLLLGLELADRVLVRDELEVARHLQRALLPERPPQVPGWRFAFSSRTANTIGGDYYDLLPLEDGRLAVIVGDASGHGIAAGLLMAIASSTIKLALDTDPAPTAVLAMVNTALYRTGDRRAFMTLYCGLLEPETGRLEFASAGHPYPVLRRANGDVSELGRGGLPLGIRRTLELRAEEVVLEPGDVMAIVTDGIPEALDPQDRAFGFDRLTASIARGGDAATVHDRLVEEVAAFVGERPADDDRSLVVLSRDVVLPPLPATGH
jgi:phosphoserine phosphatase RsbU/P